MDRNEVSSSIRKQKFPFPSDEHVRMKFFLFAIKLFHGWTERILSSWTTSETCFSRIKDPQVTWFTMGLSRVCGVSSVLLGYADTIRYPPMHCRLQIVWQHFALHVDLRPFWEFKKGERSINAVLEMVTSTFDEIQNVLFRFTRNLCFPEYVVYCYW